MSGMIWGVDPGSEKCGVAVCDGEGRIVVLKLVATADFAACKGRLPTPALIVLGDGTRSRDFQSMLGELFPTVPLEIVDEKHSTEEARALYWQLNPPRGLQRLVPEGMRLPPEPVDAYAALVLLRRRKKQND